jgi:hypothetical protein
MRPFRDPMTCRPAVIAALLTGLATMSCRNGAEKPTEAREAPVRTEPSAPSPFPLAAGNSWTFRCSAEGQFQFEKTVRISAETVAGGTRFYRTEMTRPGDAQPVVYYLFESPDATVSKTSSPSRDGAEPLVRPNMSAGERVGMLIASGNRAATSPATGETSVVQLENFSADDPAVSESRRLEWQGRSYANGIGPVIEADGLGNECVLVQYRVSKPR